MKKRTYKIIDFILSALRVVRYADYVLDLFEDLFE